MIFLRESTNNAEWHEWFAWVPTYVDGVGGVWFQTIERKWRGRIDEYDTGYDYRLIHE